MDWEEAEETRSRRSRGGKTAARTARTADWDEGVFSDEEEGGGGLDARTLASARSGKTAGARQPSSGSGGLGCC